MNSREKRCFLKSCLHPLLIVWLSWCVGWRLSAILDLEAYSWSMRLENSYKFMRRMRKKNYIYWKHAAAAKLLQSCPTLCNPIDSSPPGSPVPGILQARTLKWVAVSFSNAWKWKVRASGINSLPCYYQCQMLPDYIVHSIMAPEISSVVVKVGSCFLALSLRFTIVAVQSLSCVWFFATPWTTARQASLSFIVSQSLLRLMSIE